MDSSKQNPLPLEMWINRRVPFCLYFEEHKIAVAGQEFCHLNKLPKQANKHPPYQSAAFLLLLLGMKAFEEKNHTGIHGSSRRLNSTVVSFEAYDHEVNCQNCWWKRW